MSDEIPETDDEFRAHILEAVVPDLIGEFLYYGRKEDESLPVGTIERLIAEGKLTVDEIVNAFSDELKNYVPAPGDEVEDEEPEDDADGADEEE